MPTATPTVPTIDRSEFDQLAHLGAAAWRLGTHRR